MRTVLSHISVCVGAVVIAACNRGAGAASSSSQADAGPSICAQRGLDPKPNGGVEITGLDETAHRPIVIYEDVNAWSGSPEGLPALTIYEDGLAIRATGKTITTGYVDGSIALGHCVAQSLVGLFPRIDASRATDQPEVSVRARVGNVWRSSTVVGLHAGDEVTAPNPTVTVPRAFLDIRNTLINLPLRDEKPLVRADFNVTLHDDGVPSASASAWPSGVPGPPAGLVPDKRWVGSPRSYPLQGDAGASLQAFARSTHGYPVTTPAGDRVSVMVELAIPDEAYIKRVSGCFPWEVHPFHVCPK